FFEVFCGIGTCFGEPDSATIYRKLTRMGSQSARKLDFRLLRNVRHVAEVANRNYTTVDQPQFNEVSRLRGARLTEDCEDLTTVEPSWDQAPVGHAIVVREVVAYLAATGGLQARHEVELHVIHQHCANAIPVAGIEERGVARQRRRRRATRRLWT